MHSYIVIAWLFHGFIKGFPKICLLFVLNTGSRKQGCNNFSIEPVINLKYCVLPGAIPKCQVTIRRIKRHTPTHHFLAINISQETLKNSLKLICRILGVKDILQYPTFSSCYTLHVEAGPSNRRYLATTLDNSFNSVHLDHTHPKQKAVLFQQKLCFPLLLLKCCLTRIIKILEVV